MTLFNKKQANNQYGNEKHPFKKKNIAKIKCFNCNSKRHFAQDCLEPKKEFNYTKVSELCVTSFIFLIDSYPL